MTRFLHPLDVGELYGVGEKTREQLHRLGLRTVGDVAHTPVATLQRGIGVAAGTQLHHLAWGTDRRTLTPRRPTHEPDKSMGADETFGRDTDDRAVVLRELLRLSAKVTGRMRTAGVAGRTVTLRVRFADFTTITRSRTLADATDVTGEVHAHRGRASSTPSGLQRARIRLVGVRVEGLVPREQVQRQLVLGARERGWEEADRAVDAAACGSAAAPYAGPRCCIGRPPLTAVDAPGHDLVTICDLGYRHAHCLPRLDGPIPDPSTDSTRACLDSGEPVAGRTPCRSPKRSSVCSSRWSRPLPRRTRSSSPRCGAAPSSAPRGCAPSPPPRVFVLGVVHAHGRRRGPADLARHPRLRGDARLRHRRPGRLARPARPGRRSSPAAARTSSSTSTTTPTAST